MSSRTLSVLYWVSTGLTVLLMGLAGVLFLFRLDGSVKVLHELRYPDYFSTFLGVTKLMGLAAVLLPVPKGLREWAYAGLIFDLLAAIFSLLASGLPARVIVNPLIPLVAVLGSYLCWRKRWPMTAMP